MGFVISRCRMQMWLPPGRGRLFPSHRPAAATHHGQGTPKSCNLHGLSAQIRGGQEAPTESPALETELCQPRAGRSAAWLSARRCKAPGPGRPPMRPCHRLRSRMTAMVGQGRGDGRGVGSRDLKTPPGVAVGDRPQVS